MRSGSGALSTRGTNLWFLAMDFIFYAVENGHNKFSEPKMNGKITLSIFGMENDFVLFWYLRALNK